MADRETLDAYARHAEEFDARFHEDKPGRWMRDFIADLPENALVLDLGCGPADSSAHLRAAGHRVDPVDASPQMVALANRKHDIGARLASFDQIDATDTYDGIWANFSLLHAPRTEMPDHLARLHRALKPGGLLHIGLKLGTGARRDRLGRFYTFYTEGELRDLLSEAGFTITKTLRLTERGLAGTLDEGILVRAHA